MGRILQQADAVIYYPGELSTHRLRVIKFLERLAEKAHHYIKPEVMECLWTIIGEQRVPGADVDLVTKGAQEAHVEAMYKSD
jgi:hypothetical protein